MKMEQNEKNYRLGRNMYILQAGLEHLVSILVGGSFLATMTKELGMSDSLTGILSSIISMGCLFQLLSVPLRPRRTKPLVIALSIANQLLFALLYIIPLSGLGQQSKTVLFVGTIIGAYLLYNIAHPKKINWMMALVDDHQRGKFTANKEIISLLAGMLFSFGMGAVTDYFAEIGEIKIAFILSALVLLVLTAGHTASMLLAVEKPLPSTQKKSLKRNIKEMLTNKNVLSVTGLFAIYYISNYCWSPFLNTYYINELGFNLKTVTGLGIAGSVARILVSRFWGKYADKNSFSVMLEKCFIILLLDRLCVAFAMPSTGIVMVTLHIVLNAVAMGGVNSAMINLVFDYVQPEKRADSLAICQAVAGTVGFLTTLLASPVISVMQGNGNHLLGMTVYAQQLLSVVSLLIVLIIIVYNRKVIMKNKKEV